MEAHTEARTAGGPRGRARRSRPCPPKFRQVAAAAPTEFQLMAAPSAPAGDGRPWERGPVGDRPPGRAADDADVDGAGAASPTTIPTRRGAATSQASRRGSGGVPDAGGAASPGESRTVFGASIPQQAHVYRRRDARSGSAVSCGSRCSLQASEAIRERGAKTDRADTSTWDEAGTGLASSRSGAARAPQRLTPSAARSRRERRPMRPRRRASRSSHERPRGR